MKKIVIVTSGQPSANPRAVKEALLLANSNFLVTFIYCQISPWADEFDEELIKENKNINWVKVGCHPIKQPLSYILVRFRSKFFKLIHKIFSNNVSVSLKASVLFSQELERETRKHIADLYIAHNLGAISAAYISAKKFNAKVGFDAEDYHRGETSENVSQFHRTAIIENKYYPLLDYCTVASPLIGTAYRSLFIQQNFTVINNVFSVNFAKRDIIKSETQTLNLFWFSQHIGPKRGLENVIAAINLCQSLNITLHLLGNIKPEYKDYLKGLIHTQSSLVFHNPVPLNDIFEIASQFDIGLAAEEYLVLNRDLALTNKIFTYLLAGNCILFSDTKAQSLFHAQYPNTGFIYKKDDPIQLSEILKQLYKDKNTLNQIRKNSLEVGLDKLNWEKEGQVFLNLIKKILDSNK